MEEAKLGLKEGGLRNSQELELRGFNVLAQGKVFFTPVLCADFHSPRNWDFKELGIWEGNFIRRKEGIKGWGRPLRFLNLNFSQQLGFRENKNLGVFGGLNFFLPLWGNFWAGRKKET